MWNKIKIGDVERIAPDKKMIDITESILSQNKMILEMNAQLLTFINSPPLIYNPSEQMDLEND